MTDSFLENKFNAGRFGWIYILVNEGLILIDPPSLYILKKYGLGNGGCRKYTSRLDLGNCN